MLVRDMGIDGTKPFLLFVLLLLLRACFTISADDTLSKGQSLSAIKTDSISSNGGQFELGFFERGTPPNFYLGIWVKRIVGQRIVWVANRENHLSDPYTSRLEFSEDGNLVLLDASSKKPFWSTSLPNLPSNSTEAALLDDGNLVLRDRSDPSTLFWESFDYPTDTWLAGGALGIDKAGKVPKQLISWKNSEDPSPGLFSLSLRKDPNGSSDIILEWNRSQVYWSSGVWDGKVFTLVPEMTFNSIYNFSFVSNENETYFTYSLYNASILLMFSVSYRGQIQQLSWVYTVQSVEPWFLFWSQPKLRSEDYALCGPFGIYQGNTSQPCDCPKGFEPFSDNQTRLNDWSGGCLRRQHLQCENLNAKNDWFQKIPNIILPINWKAYSAMRARRCKLVCMNNCSCTAYTHNSSGCLIWEGALLNMQRPSDSGKVGQDIYLRLAADERQISNKGTKWKVWVIVAVLVASTGLILCLSVCFSIKRKLKHKGETAASSNDLMLFDLSTETHAISDGTNSQDNDKKRGKKDVELPLFSYESVLAATDNFSTANKLGEGGFGPVYKGKLLKGKEIAVKMLSKRSGQGLEEFRNETTLIAKLQHRNLVKLLGCCIEGDEKILIYEYMPNKSLDFYLFDLAKKKMLDWETRIHIIEGIAQGLLYLHRYSRLRIIHRDMKPSNILLDSEMNPKISDFGMARIVGDNEIQANTNRIVGTFGYMSPEYAMEGLYSIKSDVFSFGVLLLEIVSGKKNTGFYNHGSLNLLRYAWELWRDGQSLELMDSTIGYPSSTSILVRYINIGLLCVQESPDDRPTMLDVVSMMSNEYVPLPTPKQPAFTASRNLMHTNPTVNSVENCSINSVTVSVMEAR
ncbi:receptor-like serine/threonine-protein kinase SD1-8 [Juglans microcarpa x Juglans regia]|uniref:receptor-like serine/threonine-protein kinase SD1-8 n=1 Tax=Juglans microcarpa x Juglans regia TaxID=2249226 RepID=UPI001B7E1BF4|nr:receptor-like serine/threonine-protein kinase SD1-8 [Juglans microcarpa x Juglans regia]